MQKATKTTSCLGVEAKKRGYALKSKWSVVIHNGHIKSTYFLKYIKGPKQTIYVGLKHYTSKRGPIEIIDVNQNIVSMRQAFDQ